MPSRALPCAGTAAREWPAKTIPPPCQESRPITVRSSVVLPAPLRPMSPAICPRPTESDAPRRILVDLIDTSRRSMDSTVASRAARSLLADDKFSHFGIAQHRVGLAVGDDPAFVESEHPARVPPNHLDIVLDEEHRHPRSTDRLQHDVHQPEFLLCAHPAGRLVEQ